MTQRNIAVYFVTIATTFLDAGDIPSIDKVTDDRLGGALGNAHEIGDVPGAEVRIAGEANQNMAVVGEKGPLRLV
jgi:hypothetical protein